MANGVETYAHNGVMYMRNLKGGKVRIRRIYHKPGTLDVLLVEDTPEALWARIAEAAEKKQKRVSFKNGHSMPLIALRALVPLV